MSNETKHTPGRFYATKAGNDTQGLIVPEGDGPTIAVTYRAEDATLLAAAPALLEALEWCLSELECHAGHKDAKRKAYAAIRDARESTP